MKGAMYAEAAAFNEDAMSAMGAIHFQSHTIIDGRGHSSMIE